MASDDDGKPQPPGTVTPFTTAGQFAGLARETLESLTGVMNIAGLARETLMAGTGLAGTGHASSSIRAMLSLTSAGVSLAGHITATSRASQTPLAITALSGRASGTLRLRSAYTATVSLSGRIVTAAEASIDLPGIKPVAGTATATSSMRATLGIGLRGRIESMARARIGQLATPIDVAGRIAARSSGKLFVPAQVALSGRIQGRSRGRIYFAPQAAGRSRAVTLNVG
jgi:hypothetical protein